MRQARTTVRGVVVAWFAAAMVVAVDPSHAADREFKYAGSKKCRSCHRKEAIGNQYEIWLDSKHAKAYETLGSDQAREWGADAGVDDPQKSEKCLKCHVTAFGVDADRLGLKFELEDGVQCEACHGAGSGYAKKKIMMDRDRAVANGLRLPDEESCVTCHNDESPAWDPERYTRPDGTKVGFDYDQALETIAHPVPEDYDPSSEGEAD